jgi:DNA-binding MarR family transcriptional regulator
MIYESMIIGIESAIFSEAQRVSKALFGNQDRLIVASFVAEAEPGEIYGQRIAERLGISDNRVGPQLNRFESAGLLTRLPKVGSERRQYFERRDSAFWELCAELCRDIAGTGEAPG